jgi:hypothetical protein
MAKFFQYTPEQVDSMDKERVYKMLWLEERWKEKENADSKKHNGKRL